MVDEGDDMKQAVDVDDADEAALAEAVLIALRRGRVGLALRLIGRKPDGADEHEASDRP